MGAATLSVCPLCLKAPLSPIAILERREAWNGHLEGLNLQPNHFTLYQTYSIAGCRAS